MSKGQKPRRGRAKSSHKRGSNGAAGNRMENKSRGNPKQNIDKYTQQAQDARQQGDRVMEQYYLQFVDHFTRIMNERNANAPQKHKKKPNGKSDDAPENAGNVAEQKVQNGDAKPKRKNREPETLKVAPKPEAEAAEAAPEAKEAV